MITSKRKTRLFIDRDMISEHLNCPICLDVMDNPNRTKCGYRIYNVGTHSVWHASRTG